VSAESSRKDFRDQDELIVVGEVGDRARMSERQSSRPDKLLGRDWQLEQPQDVRCPWGGSTHFSSDGGNR
jgi:hypothetical protein